MKIYIDVVFILNLFFDFILLLSVSFILKRRVKLYKIILGSVLGSLSTFLLFTTITSFELFIYKIVTSIMMIVISFDFKNIRYTIKNIICLYVVSIFLGGALYFINNQLSYKQMGLVFVNNGLSINVIIMIVITPVITILYIKHCKSLKTKYNNYYKVDIYINQNIIHTTSLLDTGNNLKDPYTFKPVLLLSGNDLLFKKNKYLLIPYHTVKNNGFIKGYKIDKIYIEGIGYKYNLIVALVDSLKMDGVDSIISPNILEGT